MQSFPGYTESSFRIEGKKIVRANGVRHEIDIYVSVILGTGYDAVFIFECKNQEEKVNKNDIIVFYSDGIGDAQSRSGEFFGAGRVAKLVSESTELTADGLADKILEEADAFSGGQHPADDRTLLVLKVR